MSSRHDKGKRRSSRRSSRSSSRTISAQSGANALPNALGMALSSSSSTATVEGTPELEGTSVQSKTTAFLSPLKAQFQADNGFSMGHTAPSAPLTVRVRNTNGVNGHPASPDRPPDVTNQQPPGHEYTGSPEVRVFIVKAFGSKRQAERFNAPAATKAIKNYLEETILNFIDHYELENYITFRKGEAMQLDHELAAIPKLREHITARLQAAKRKSLEQLWDPADWVLVVDELVAAKQAYKDLLVIELWLPRIVAHVKITVAWLCDKLVRAHKVLVLLRDAKIGADAAKLDRFSGVVAGWSRTVFPGCTGHNFLVRRVVELEKSARMIETVDPADLQTRVKGLERALAETLLGITIPAIKVSA